MEHGCRTDVTIPRSDNVRARVAKVLRAVKNESWRMKRKSVTTEYNNTLVLYRDRRSCLRFCVAILLHDHVRSSYLARTGYVKLATL